MTSNITQLKNFLLIKNLNNNVIFNITTHQYLLDFTDELFLANLASSFKCQHRLSIGGSESLRDLYKAKLLNSDALLVPNIESNFAIEKAIQSINSIFLRDNLKEIKIFIVVSSINSLKDFSKVKVLDKYSFSKNNVYFLLDRRLILYKILKLDSFKFNVDSYKKKDNEICEEFKEICDKNKFLFGFKGGMTPKSVKLIKEKFNPDFIDTGFFTLFNKTINDLISNLDLLYKVEKDIFVSMQKIHKEKFNIMSNRINHLSDYLKE